MHAYVGYRAVFVAEKLTMNSDMIRTLSLNFVVTAALLLALPSKWRCRGSFSGKNEMAVHSCTTVCYAKVSAEGHPDRYAL